MRILVDLTYIHNKDKIRESVALYAIRFLRALNEQQRINITLLVVPSMKDEVLQRVGMYNSIEFFDILSPLKKIPYLKGALRTINWKRQLNNLNYDVLYLPFSWSGNSGKVTMKKIITIHDLRPMRKATRAFTNTYLFKILGLKKIYLKAIKYFYNRHIHNAHKIIAISNYVRTDIISEWPQAIDKTFTIYNSVKIPDVLPKSIKSLIGNKFILYVNTLSKYKNISTLIKAYYITQRNAFSDIKLVIVGKTTEYWESEMLPLIKQLNLCNLIEHINYAEDEELAWLYQNALLFISPSLNEGFGYTPIEAAIQKCPVLTSRCESLPDVTAERVHYYNSPMSESELAAKIKYIIENPDSDLKLTELSKFFKGRYSEDNQVNQILSTFSCGL